MSVVIQHEQRLSARGSDVTDGYTADAETMFVSEKRRACDVSSMTLKYHYIHTTEYPITSASSQPLQSEMTTNI